MQEDDLLPVRSVNAYTFCPRLFWLEQVEGVFEDNAHTLEGQHTHRRVDKPGGALPAPMTPSPEADEDEPAPPVPEPPPWHARSLWLSDPSLGVSGRLDLVEEEGQGVMPVDTKKGSPPDAGGLWPADRVQLTLQGLLLKGAGYTVGKVAAWYAAARRRVEVELTPELEREATEAVAAARRCAGEAEPPPPLVDSPKCEGCSLQPICLPDELNALRFHPLPEVPPSRVAAGEGEAAPADSAAMRRIQSPRDDALPLYVQATGARVGLSHGCLKISPRRDTGEPEWTIGLDQLSQLNLMGPCHITGQALQACLHAEIPVSWFSTGGWFYGRSEAVGSRQIHVRLAQHRTYGGEGALAIAKSLIGDKIANARTLLRRNQGEGEGATDVLDRMKRLVDEASRAEQPASLLGIEGEAAHLYWGEYSALLGRIEESFAMKGRTRRPPRDATNAMLSYGYALLSKDATLACVSAGMDPHLGMYHTPHHGRPSLALDLMEPFRPLVVDSLVLRMIASREVAPADFIYTGQAVAMKPHLRKALIQAYERRMDELITHPVFGYRLSYRRTMVVHARLLARTLLGEVPTLPSFRTR